MSRLVEQPSPLRVLLVEDYLDLAEATAEYLKREGLDVRIALSGGEALEIASTFQPQLLLCDLSLPDMSGLDVIRTLRSRPSTAATYAVILTAMRAANTERVGADAFIAKPITVEAIRRLMERVATRHQPG